MNRSVLITLVLGTGTLVAACIAAPGCTGDDRTPDDAGALQSGPDADAARPDAAAELDAAMQPDSAPPDAGAPACASIAPIFAPVTQSAFTDPYVEGPGFATAGTGGFGFVPDVPTVWRYWRLDNRFENGSLSQAELRVWTFRPPAGRTGSLSKGNTATGVVAVSISPCPGQFTGLASTCVGRFGSLTWSTAPSASPASVCVLDPSRDYYVNAAAIDVATLAASGVYDAPPCDGASCTSPGLYQVQIVALQNPAGASLP